MFYSHFWPGCLCTVPTLLNSSFSAAFSDSSVSEGAGIEPRTVDALASGLKC